MHTVDCAGCGTEFQCRHKRKYCTKQCRKRIINARFKRGCFVGPMQQAVIGPRDCAICGGTFTPKQNNYAKFCSKRCSDRRPRRFLKCQRCGKEFGTTKGIGVNTRYCSAECRRKPKYSKVWFKLCSVCGKVHCTNITATKTCKLCRDSYPQYTRNKVAAGDAVTACWHCGVKYCRITTDWQRYCSDECREEAKARGKRAHKAKRRKHITDGDSFDPYEIFERDKWCCRHCRRKAPKRLRGTYHPRAPELDHIVPLSQGGKHCKANAQLLCRECNQTKSNGSLYDQTLLFG